MKNYFNFNLFKFKVCIICIVKSTGYLIKLKIRLINLIEFKIEIDKEIHPMKHFFNLIQFTYI